MGNPYHDTMGNSETLILALAGRLEALYDVVDSLDNTEISAISDARFAKSKGCIAAHLETVRQANDKTIGCVEQSIVENPAESLPDAAIQLMLAAGFTDCVRNGCKSQADFYLEKVAMLIDSALAVIIRDTGLKIADYGAGRYIPNYASFSARNQAREITEMLELNTAQASISSQLLESPEEPKSP